ncbi:metal ABC transporter substrate-binding protein [Terrarubrum flagellatum]|uniref:metal ABC transporter substrate-binding protein n=1 Tax=Terrirubrum flagellatum TaxID=2895980 RepID=UPI003144E32E
MPSRRYVIASAIGLALTAAAGPALAQAEKLKVVASFSILGDLVKQVGGERLDITTLVGPNGDTHVYSPTPADAKSLADAKLVFVNGLKFEGWMDRLVKSSGSKAALIVATKGVKPLQAKDDHDHDHDHGGYDPHAFQDIGNVKLYVANIRDGLAAADPQGKATYEANATAYLKTLDGLETDVKAAIAKIPAANRKIITSHDAFGYFGKAYGMQFIAPKGVSTEAEASAKDVARIIRQVKAEKIPAVFMENIQDKRLAEQIARETGAKIGGSLFSDALSPPDGPAGTYVDLMRNNIREFVSALAPGGA